MSLIVAEAIARYLSALNVQLHEHYKGKKRIDPLEGRKFIKIVLTDVDNTWGFNRHVHSFIDKATGDLYKPASWAGPAKHVRYNLVRDWLELEPKIDPYGSYLYMK